MNKPELSTDWRLLTPRLILAIVASLVPMGAAQSQHATASPYSGLGQRIVKALSDEQVADLRAGRGMGLALPA